MITRITIPEELDEQDIPWETQERVTASMSQEPKPGNLYLLPKSHKPASSGHPIVSGSGTLMVGVSDYVDSILFPYARGF